MSTEIIWMMDSDICDECGGLIGYFGICTECGYDGIEESEWDEWDGDEDDFYPDDWDDYGR